MPLYLPRFHRPLDQPGESYHRTVAAPHQALRTGTLRPEDRSAASALSYNAAYKAVHTIRAAIVAHAADGNVFLGGEVEVDESYFGGKQTGKH